ncbi:MAG: hypothetical protein ACTSWY_01485 [Promethearchaeota archaeon]
MANEMTVIMKQSSETGLLCPKCGSSMINRKIWKKSKAISIKQCTVCKYYMLLNDSKV